MPPRRGAKARAGSPAGPATEPDIVVRAGKRQCHLLDCGLVSSDGGGAAKVARCVDGGAGAARASSGSGSVLCREHEALKLGDLIENALMRRQGVPIYVPGQPGSGKTHTVKAVLGRVEAEATAARPPPAVTYVNCVEKPAAKLGAHICGLMAERARRGRPAAAAHAAGAAAGTATRPVAEEERGPGPAHSPPPSPFKR